MAENKMGIMPVNKLIFNMSLPIIFSMVVQALYNIVDSIFVGMINEQSLTAVSLAFPAQNLMIAVATGTAVGVNALVSRALGEKNSEKADRLAENGVFLAFMSFAVFLIFGIFGSRAFMESQTKVPFIIEEGTKYVRICCCLSFGIFFQIIFERLLQATGRTYFTLCTHGVGATLNLIFDPLFIFVFKMGVSGAAYATVLGQIVACIIAFILNKKKNAEINVHLKGFRPSGKLIGKIYTIGVPSIIMVAIGSVMTYCMNKILILFTPGKETAATVFGAFFKLNSFICMPIFGLNNGIVPIIAYNYGARHKERMLKTIELSVMYAEICSITGAILFLAIPEVLLGFFSASPQMLSIGIPALRIIGSSFFVAGASISLGAAFQALGKSVLSMVVSAVRQLVVLTPAAYILAKYGMRVGNRNLVWLSYPVAEIFAIVLSIVSFVYIYNKVIKKIKSVK